MAIGSLSATGVAKSIGSGSTGNVIVDKRNAGESIFPTPSSNSTNNYYYSGLSQDDLRNILANLNLSNPQEYLQSALDVAMYNNDASQALAREQMKFQTEANAKAMEFNANEAAKTRDYTLMMSNTAHQREVADLIAAGLNPILSANQGASTGNFANANGVTSSGAKGSIDTGLIGAMTNAYTQAMNLKLQEKQIDAQLAMNLLNNETTRYAADKGAYGAVTAAGLNSSASRYAADLNKQIYEAGWHGLGSVLGNIGSEGIQTIQHLLNSSNPADAVVDMITNMFPWTKEFFNFDEKPYSSRNELKNELPNGSGYRTNSRSYGGHFTE